MQTGMEERPCMCCRSFLKDQKRLIEHLISCGLEAQPDGTFMSPIRKDFVDEQGLRRANQRLAPWKFGFCQQECRVVEDQATCEKWVFSPEIARLIERSGS